MELPGEQPDRGLLQGMGTTASARLAHANDYKVLFYMMYLWWPGLESNQRHGDFQTPMALSMPLIFNNLRTPAPR